MGTEVPDPICVGTEVPDPFWAFPQKTVFKACLGTEVPVPFAVNIAERRIRCIIQ